MAEKILEGIKKLREGTKKRKFSQTFDLIVNLKDIDVKKEGKMNEDFRLPSGLGREARVAFFSDSIRELAGAEILTSSDIQSFAKDKRSGKRMIRDTDFFLSEPRLMPLIGKALGQTLAPKGKMPKIASANAKSDVESLRHSTRIRIKDAPVIQCPIGREDMEDTKIADNVKAVVRHLEAKLPKGRNNIKEVLLKLSMGKPMRLEVW